MYLYLAGSCVLQLLLKVIAFFFALQIPKMRILLLNPAGLWRKLWYPNNGLFLKNLCRTEPCHWWSHCHLFPLSCDLKYKSGQEVARGGVFAVWGLFHSRVGSPNVFQYSLISLSWDYHWSYIDIQRDGEALDGGGCHRNLEWDID